MFLALTSILNIILDLVFVIVFHGGIAGVAYATILSQFISAGLTLLLLTRSRDIYRLVWRDLHIDPAVTRQIFSVGMPAGIQSVITSISNVFVQSYVNYFGSACMAGWSCYNKLDQFMMLPMQSMSMASTTFVGQNMGAGNEDRANRGTFITVAFTEAVMVFVAIALFVLAAPATALFTQDQSVIDYGVLFLRANVFFILFNCVNHVLAGGLRGRGDARGPMVIMLSCFVVLRQIYLFIMTRFVANTPFVVGFGYPVGWVSCCIIEIAYFRIRWGKKKTASASTQG
jgi:putative MATE family efflux protein